MTFAEEYYVMALECRMKYHDNVAAIANLNKTLQLAPTHINALLLRIAINIETGDYATALADANTALDNKCTKREKQATELLRLRATIHQKQCNYGNAYDDLRKALYIIDDEPSTYYMLADISRRLGKDDEAEQYRNIAEDLDE